MKLIALSLIDIGQLGSPEIILGFVSTGVLLVVITVGFIFKRRQGKK